MQIFADIWPIAIATIQFAAMLGAAGHAMLTKSDVRSAAGWVGFILLVPFIGWLVYLLLGVNRIQRRARELRGLPRGITLSLLSKPSSGELPSIENEERFELENLARFGQKIHAEPLETGNVIDILENGDEAYPAMIAAIDAAVRSIAMSTYIFNNDKAGHLFISALSRAHERGVRLRVMIDGVGSWYSRPSIIPELRKHQINYARFLHSFMPWKMPYLNMRNHQKILVIDGIHGFTGGMNISEGNLVKSRPKKPIHDIHFRVKGPVVGQLMRTFAYEWTFTTGEILDGADWFPEIVVPNPQHGVVARSIPAGPDQSMNPILWTMLAALTEAHESIRIVTPYFLPDSTLTAVLSVAAMRGVKVDIVLPATNNLPFVDWASTPQLAWLIDAGCNVWKSSGPFVHSKLMTIDGIWSMIGSANWDGRSLRLNFELNLECYDRPFARRLDHLIDKKIAAANAVTRQSIADRSLPIRLRDAIIRLASPYL